MDKIQLAGCVIIKDNAILLLHRIKTNWYELPGGKIDEGEKPEETAVRELQEELLCTVTILKKLGEKDFTDNGYIMGYTWFLAQIDEGEEPQIGEPDKFDNFTYFPIEKLPNLSLSPNMQNLFSELQANKISL